MADASFILLLGCPGCPAGLSGLGVVWQSAGVRFFALRGWGVQIADV